MKVRFQIFKTPFYFVGWLAPAYGKDEVNPNRKDEVNPFGIMPVSKILSDALPLWEFHLQVFIVEEEG